MKIPPLHNTFDFAAAAKENGYIKARLMLQLMTAEQNQKDIDFASANDHRAVMRNKLKAKEDQKISRTIGLVNTESHIEKVLSLVGRNQLAVYHEIENSADRIFDNALATNDSALLMAQSGLECFPYGFGDTLFLQTGFIKSMKCPGNQFKYMTPRQLPQFSTYHFRYVREIDFSSNNIKSLPSEIGNLQLLQSLDLSHNLLSSLPSSISYLKHLKDLNISNNSFNALPAEFALLSSLTRLNMSANTMTEVPPSIVKLTRLKSLDLSSNSLQHLAVMSLKFRSSSELWKRTLSEKEGRFVYFNMLTKETVYHIASSDGRELDLAKDLHVFQPSGTTAYERRKFWLSVNKVHEWEAVLDDVSTWWYYRNNVSGETQW